MPRRIGGKKYLADTNTKEIHDLDNEQLNCQINEIIDAESAVFYDSLEQADADGYCNGHLCLEQDHAEVYDNGRICLDKTN